MQNSSQVFKTLRKVDGKDYVELSEVLELFKTLASMPSFFTGVAKTLQEVQGNLTQSISRDFLEEYTTSST